jgi:hypothetical protein
VSEDAGRIDHYSENAGRIDHYSENAGLINAITGGCMGYPGGKNAPGVCQVLINAMPPHTAYCEPFLGGGAVLLHKKAAALNIGIDLDARAVHGVRTQLQSRRADRAEIHPRQNGAACSTTVSDDATSTDIAIGMARYRLLVGDGVEFLRTYPWSGAELVYADPPYIRSSRRSSTRLYRYEMTDAQHASLIAILRGLPCAVMLSGYMGELYADLLHDWRTLTYTTQTRGGPAEEMVWLNFPVPTTLHQYTFLGANFRERERQKRLRTRWAKKVAAKPLLEQRALLTQLLTLVDAEVGKDVMQQALAHFGDEVLLAHPDVPAETPHTARATKCTICHSPDRARIDQALRTGEAIRDIALWENISKSVIGRHRAHVCPTSVPLPSNTQTSQTRASPPSLSTDDPRA